MYDEFRTYHKVPGINDPKSIINNDYNTEQGREVVYPPDETADVISSIGHDGDFHYPVIDIDLPVRVVPSAQEGHFHLYIDFPVHKEQYFKMLRAMAEAGIVEHGYVNACEQRGYTSVRVPWKPKPEHVYNGIQL